MGYQKTHAMCTLEPVAAATPRATSRASRYLLAGAALVFGAALLLGALSLPGAAAGATPPPPQPQARAVPGRTAIDHAGSALPAALDAADLALAKSIVPASVQPGERVTTTLVFTATGTETMTGVLLTDALPFTLTGAIVVSSGVAITQTGGAPAYAWQVADLPPGAGGTVTITGRLAVPWSAGTLTNTASITATGDTFLANNTASASLTVLNAPPLAAADAYTIAEDTALIVPAPGVLGSDTDLNGDVLTATLLAAPQTGALALDASGALTYTPALNFNGWVTATVVVSDSALTATSALTLVVTPVNDAPVAADDAYTTTEDTPLVVPAPGVLGNDNDVEGAVLTATLAAPPLTGTLLLAPDGGLVYTPTLDFHGAVTATVVVSDGVLIATSALTLVVTPVNDAPLAADDAYTTTEDVALVVPAPGVLGNDTDVDGDVLASTLLSGPVTGTLILDATGALTYTAPLHYHGVVTATVRVSDGVLTDTATVTLTVSAVNDAPVARDDAYLTGQDTALTVPAPGVLGNDTDPDSATDGQVLTATVSGAPLSGTLALALDGGLVFTPTLGFHGVVTAAYTASDGALTDTARITITVNDPPLAVADAYTTSEDTLLVVPAPGVLGNDNDPNGDVLFAVLLTPPQTGALLLDASGALTYTPALDHHGMVTATYCVSDGVLTDTAVITLLVLPVNDAPVAASDAYTTPEDTALVVPAPGVLGNDADADGDPLTVTQVTTPLTGTLAWSPDGVLVYTPTLDFHGAVTATVEVSDGVLTATSALTLVVTPVNDAPVAADDAYTTTEDTPLVVPAPGVLGNDSDVDGDVLASTLLSGPVTGTLILDPTGALTYTPALNFNGWVTATVEVSDGALTATSALTLVVTPVNDAPLAASDTYTTPEDTVLVVPAPGVLGNDSDVEGAVLTATLAAPPLTGTLLLAPDGGLVYTPTLDFYGAITATVVVSDGALTATSALTLVVTPVNDAPVAADDAYTTTEDVALVVPAPGVLGNDTDVDGDVLASTLLSGPVTGTLILDATGALTYTAPLHYHGVVTATVRVSDGVLTDTATVTLTVSAVNDAPVARDDAYLTGQDTALTVPAPGVLGNDSDADSATDGQVLTATVSGAPLSGTLALALDGGLVFTPTLGFHGVVTAAYTASDGALTDTARITITVNDPPLAVADAYTTSEDTLLVVPAPGVLGSDSDPNGDVLFAVLLTPPQTGILALDASGALTYTPALDHHGMVTATILVSDGALTDTAAITLSVLPVNDRPVAADDSYVTDEDVTLSVGAALGVLANDLDVDEDMLTATLWVSPSTGSLVLNADGSFVYAPAPDASGVVTFTYVTSDGVLTDTAAVTLTVAAVNDAPVAGDNAYTLVEDTVKTVAAPGLLANDSDVDSPTLTALLVAAPAGGAVTVYPDGGFVFTPTLDFFGVTTFTYAASDGALTGAATVTLTVTPVNDGPVAMNDAYVTPEDVPLAVARPGVLGNDIDVDGDDLSALRLSDPATGTVTLGTQGDLIYIPPDNYNGAVTFTYRVRDGQLSDTGLVTITVAPVNDPPVAVDDVFITPEDVPLVAPAPGVLENDIDLDGDVLTVTPIDLPATGDLLFRTDGSFVYTPTLNAYGWVTFTYRASDSKAQDIGLVTLYVNSVPDAPIAVAESYVTAEDTPLVVPAPGVLANDTDGDGDPLSAIKIADPATGTLVLAGSGAFTYTPPPNYYGQVAFTYAAFDGVLTGTATVTITVTSVNDAPVASDDSYVTQEDVPLTVARPGVLGNDSDVDGDSLTAFRLTKPSHGSVVLSSLGDLLYVPASNYHGQVSFTYRAYDGALSSVATVTITVAPQNDAPTAVNDTYLAVEGTLLTVPAPGVLGNDSDPENDPLTAIRLSDPPVGALTFSSSGAFTYLSPPNYAGEVTFTYAASDGVLTDTAIVTLTVVSQDDPPIARDDVYAVGEDTVMTMPAPGVLSNDSDPEGGPLTAAVFEAPATGALTLDANGAFTYTPVHDFHGVVTFTYRASDGNSWSIPAVVTITVTPKNDPPTISDTGNQTAFVGQPLSLSITIGDVDTPAGDLVFDVSSGDPAILPASGIVVGGAGAARTATLTPIATGQVLVTAIVSDGVATAYDTFWVEVRYGAFLPVVLRGNVGAQ